MHNIQVLGTKKSVFEVSQVLQEPFHPTQATFLGTNFTACSIDLISLLSYTYLPS